MRTVERCAASSALSAGMDAPGTARRACRHSPQALKDGKRLLKDGSAAAAMVRFEKALMLAKVGCGPAQGHSEDPGCRAAACPGLPAWGTCRHHCLLLLPLPPVPMRMVKPARPALGANADAGHHLGSSPCPTPRRSRATA